MVTLLLNYLWDVPTLHPRMRHMDVSMVIDLHMVMTVHGNELWHMDDFHLRHWHRDLDMLTDMAMVMPMARHVGFD